MNREPESRIRSGRDLFAATKPFAVERRGRSWWLVGSTLALLLGALAGAALSPWWPLRLAFSLIGGLLLVRSFVIFHDFMHGAILRGSRLGRVLMAGVGSFLLTPPRAWRETHNHHHANVGRIAADDGDSTVVATDIGEFPMMSLEKWARASRFQRLRYRLIRHPLTIFAAYLTVFMGALCLGSAFSNPRKHWPGFVIFLAHLAVLCGLWFAGGWWMVFFTCLLPLWVASAMGAYLFYAQHSFPGARVYVPEDWNIFEAALATSSYFKLSRVMDWFTASIGYHHIHHINSKIPFYRLREVMEAIPEFQNPVVTRMRLRDLRACFQANLWDAGRQCMVSYADARRTMGLVG